MKILIRAFFLLIVVYHIVHTAIVYGRGGVDTFFVAGLKDILWVVLCGVVCIVGGRFLSKQRALLLVLAVLILWSLGYSLSMGVDLKSIMVGFKYDIWPLVVASSGLLLGSYAAKKGRNITSAQSITTLFHVVVVILVAGLLWQGGKVMFPDLFGWLGYGPVGDYVLGGSPPIWYRTGSGGVMRLQGIFAGPNNYGYFLVALFPLMILWAVRCWKQSSWKIRSGGGLMTSRAYMLAAVIVFVASLILTISRGAVVGILFQSFLLLWFFRKQARIYLLGCVAIAIGAVALFSFSPMKQASTMARFAARSEGLGAAWSQPRGYGLGSAGPSVHYQGVYLPENQYLQIILDIGRPGFLLWCLFWIVFLVHVYSLRKKTADDAHAYLLIIAVLLGIAGLGIEGLFLHALEDSMVNYIFFGLSSLFVGWIGYRHT